MSTDHSWLEGGFRYIHQSGLATNAPISEATCGALIHNQELIAATIQPRHLVNHRYPADGATPATVSLDGRGQLIDCWGRIPTTPGLEMAIRLRYAIANAEGCTEADSWWICTPGLPSGSEYVGDLETAYSGTEHYSKVRLDSSSFENRSLFTIRPNPRWRFFYIQFWAAARGDPTDTIDLKLGTISIRERRRSDY